MTRCFLPLLVVLGACSEYDIQSGGPGVKGGVPDIELSTDALQFGPTAGSETETQTVMVKNVGEAPLKVTDLLITAGENAFSVATSPTDFVVEIGDEVPVDVDFTPFLSDNYGVLQVQSNDPDEAALDVDLYGIGAVPELALDPADYSFPSGCEDTVYVTLENVGNDTLVITDLNYSGDAELTLESLNSLPLELPPGTEAGVNVRFQPTGLDPVAGTLSVTSNDPRGVQDATQDATPGVSNVIDSFTTQGDPPIDIVFALDKSGSMSGEMGSLANAFSTFIQDINLATQDWRIGVVSKDHGCFNNGIITPATPYYEDVFDDAVRGLQFCCTDLTEALLELTSNAMWETVPGGCNDGFSRSNAVLHLVLVSDEPEQSGTDWSVWVSQFQAAKQDPALLVISSVVDLNNDCGRGADGYTQASNATGGLILDVCNSDWGTYAAQLGAASAASLRTFHLSAVPNEPTITVSFDGVVYPNGWHYDAVQNAVVVDVELPAGATLDISYEAVGC